MDTLDRWMGGVGRAASFIAGVMLAAIVIINFANVVGRYVLSAPISWAEEIMLFLMISAVFLSNLRISRDGAHIRMDMLLRFVPEGARKGLEALADLTSIALAGVMCWMGVPIVKTLFDFGQTSDAAGVPVWIPQSVIPLSFGLVGVALLIRLIARGPGGGAVPSEDGGHHEIDVVAQTADDVAAAGPSPAGAQERRAAPPPPA